MPLTQNPLLLRRNYRTSLQQLRHRNFHTYDEIINTVDMWNEQILCIWLVWLKKPLISNTSFHKLTCPPRPHCVLNCYIELQLTVKTTARTKPHTVTWSTPTSTDSRISHVKQYISTIIGFDLCTRRDMLSVTELFELAVVYPVSP